jgi:DNA-binding CsgD family transcriptional regulator
MNKNIVQTIDDVELITFNNALSICKASPVPTGIKDMHSLYLAANPLAVWFAGCRHEEQMLSKTDFDFYSAYYAEQFICNDQLALSGKSWVGYEETYWRNLGHITVFAVKTPIYDNHKEQIVGIIYWGFSMAKYNFTELISALDKAKRQKRQPYFSGYHQDQLAIIHKITQRESMCLFYLIRGKSAKEIGNILGISNRTAESYIENLKLKFNCYYKSELIEKAINMGFLNTLPFDLFSE